MARYYYFPTGAVRGIILGNSISMYYMYHISGAVKKVEIKDIGGRICSPKLLITRIAVFLVANLSTTATSAAWCTRWPIVTGLIVDRAMSNMFTTN